MIRVTAAIMIKIVLPKYRINMRVDPAEQLTLLIFFILEQLFMLCSSKMNKF